MDELDIFSAALELEAPSERQRYLDQACRGNAALRTKINALLRWSGQADSFMELPPVADLAAATLDRPITEGPGTRIGPYKLLQQIGEGGFGVVYMAEQQQPVRRKVALKIIKPGMDTNEVIARFESERQALALMDHPNIAKVLDASATDSGRPYFVMELVKGTPITQFCDNSRLPPNERLELFIQVCHALQHAHQKGIIHRDLKPTNVMVTMHDGRPVPKVIDFGVAKATSQTLTERTLFTAYGQMIGTPAYMSPEQAEMSCLDIDTRSDIYSLGVLLYELLTGSTPFDGRRLREAGFAEMQRIIRDEEPPKPSTRVSTLQGQALTTLLQHHGIDERRLRQLFRGELDWIVMKSLDKDRERRYESASSLARDLRRYLSDEPVQACPPSAFYRFRKYAKKHRASLTTVAIVVLTLLMGTAGSSWQAMRATQAEAEARANEARALAEEHKARVGAASERAAKKAEAIERQRAEAELRRAESNFRQAYWAFDELALAFDPERSPQGLSVDELRNSQADTIFRFLARFSEQPNSSSHDVPRLIDPGGRQIWFGERQSDDPASRLQRGITYFTIGEIHRHLSEREKAEEAFDQAITLFDGLRHSFPNYAVYPYELHWALWHKAQNRHQAGRLAEANDCWKLAVKVLRDAAKQHPTDVAIPSQLAFLLCTWFDAELYDIPTARTMALRAVELAPHLYKSWFTLGIAFYRSGEWSKAVEALNTAQGKADDDAPNSRTRGLLFLAMAKWQCSQRHEAILCYQEAVQRMETSFRDRGPINRAIRMEAEELFGIRKVRTAEGDWPMRGEKVESASKPGSGGAQVEAHTRKLQVDALLTEAIHLYRALAVEFPDNADYQGRLAALLKLPSQYAGPNENAAKTQPDHEIPAVMASAENSAPPAESERRPSIHP